MTSEPVMDRLERWYARQCNGDWEHTYGIEIGNSDNPGWLIKIDLEDTDLEQTSFQTRSEPARGGGAYLFCERSTDERGNTVFRAACSAGRLQEVLTIFLDWAEANARPA